MQFFTEGDGQCVEDFLRNMLQPKDLSKAFVIMPLSYGIAKLLLIATYTVDERERTLIMNAPMGGGGVRQLQSIAFRGRGSVERGSSNAFLAPMDEA